MIPCNLKRHFSLLCEKLDKMLKNGLVIILFLSCAASMRAQGYTTVKTTNDKAKSAFLDGKKQSEVGASAIALGYFEDAIKKAVAKTNGSLTSNAFDEDLEVFNATCRIAAVKSQY